MGRVLAMVFAHPTTSPTLPRASRSTPPTHGSGSWCWPPGGRPAPLPTAVTPLERPWPRCAGGKTGAPGRCWTASRTDTTGWVPGWPARRGSLAGLVDELVRIPGHGHPDVVVTFGPEGSPGTLTTPNRHLTEILSDLERPSSTPPCKSTIGRPSSDRAETARAGPALAQRPARYVRTGRCGRGRQPELHVCPWASSEVVAGYICRLWWLALRR
jgi:hypothetical protein